MLSEDTAWRWRAILMRLIEELIERGAVATDPLAARRRDRSGRVPERSARVDEAIRLISRELMPRLLRPAQIS